MSQSFINDKIHPEKIHSIGEKKRNIIFDDKPPIISPVTSERSFLDYVRANFNPKASRATKKDNVVDLFPEKKPIRKILVLKSGPDVTAIDDAPESTLTTNQTSFSVSDSMLQLSGRVYLNYERLILRDSSSSSDNTSVPSSSSDSSLYCSARESSNTKFSSSTSSSSSDLSLPEPPDGGWGWIVVIAAFFVQMITDGVITSFGIFIDDLFEDFNESLSVTSWVGSFAYGIPALGAPIASILINRFGCRKVCVVGGIVSAVGCGLSFFAQSVLGLILTFGVLSGLGCSLSSTAALIIVSVYFDDHRATATGLSIAGTGVGSFIFAPLVYWLISLYTWRGAMLILSGIFANMIVCGVLMRPVETGRERHKRQLLACMESFAKETGFKLPEVYLESEDEPIDHRIHLLRKLLTSPLKLGSNDSFFPLSTCKSSPGGNETKPGMTFAQEEDLHETLKSSLDAISKDFGKSPLSLCNKLDHLKNLTTTHVFASNKDNFSICRKLSLPDNHDLNNNKNAHKNVSHDTLSSNFLANSEPDVCRPQLFTDYVKEIRLPYALRKHLDENIREKASTAKAAEQSTNEPQVLCSVPHRTPNLITLRTSLAQIQPLYSRTKRSMFHRSTVFQSSQLQLRTVLSMPELVSISHASSYSISSSSENCCTEKVKGMIDTSLFYYLDFNIFLVSNFILYFWCNATYFFITIYATEKEVSNTLAAMLLAIIGASDMVGEIAFGWAGDQKWFNVLFLYTSAVFACGLSTAFVPFATTFTSMVIYSIVFGFTMAANDSLCTVLVIEFVGLNRLVNGLGFCLFCQGIASIVGPPFIGFIMDSTNSYELGFVVCGVGVVVAGFVMIPVIVRERRYIATKRRRRLARELLATSSSTSSLAVPTAL